MNINSIISALSLDDDGLKKQCAISRYQASGPGGQKRNRVYSAVRIKHLPSNQDITSSGHRESSRNLTSALAKLRLQFALSIQPGEILPGHNDSGLEQSTLPSGWPAFRPEISCRHGDFAKTVFTALHILNRYRGKISTAAQKLQVSTSALVKFLKTDKRVWKKAQDLREQFDKPRLK